MDNTKAYCTLCKKSFSVAALGITTLHIHVKGSKHLSRLPPPIQSTLNFQCVKNVQEKQSNATEETTKSTFSSLDAEIMWALDVAMSTQPAFTCSKLTIETLEQGVKYVQS